MNDIDTLMQRIDLINAKSANELGPRDIDDLVAYTRRNRQRKAMGEKAPAPATRSADISDIRSALSLSKPAEAPLRRRSF